MAAASTQVITDITTVISTGPSNATTALAIVASGIIMDYPGNCKLLKLKFQEARNLVNKILTDTDANDASLGTLQSIQQTLT
jgi:hypothetical protein